MKLTKEQFEYIKSEISTVYELIDRQRKSTTDFLKIYLSVFLALFGYIYFIENRLVLNNIRTKLPSDDYFIFGVFGIISTLIVFVVGWALLDNVTKAIYKSIKHYKHISNLRYMLSQTFEDDSFAKNSIIPLNQKNIPIRISAQVPIIGGFLNFGLLVLLTYFFGLFLYFPESILSTLLTMKFISIFYANQLEKHFEEILVAQRLKPESSEAKIKESIKNLTKLKKQIQNYKKTKNLYILSIVIFILFIIILFVLNITSELNQYLLIIPLILFVVSIIPRIYMGIHRIKEISCFKDGNTRHNNA